MTKTLCITGANRGIGLEFVRQSLADGWQVIATCREPAKAESLRELAARFPERLRIETLDVRDWDAIERFGEKLKNTPIDWLVNNAGIYGGEGQRFGKIDRSRWLEVLETNTLAPLKVVESLSGSLKPGGVIASVSSRMGSIADNNSGAAYLYRSSKAALNAVNKSLAVDLEERGLVCVVLHPGWVKTDMGGPGAAIDAKTSVSGIRQVLDKLGPADSGKFFNYDGKELSW